MAEAAAQEKIGFWKRLALMVEAMERTEADDLWDHIRYLRKENESLKARLDALETQRAA